MWGYAMSVEAGGRKGDCAPLNMGGRQGLEDVGQCRRARRLTLASQPHMGAESLWISNTPHPTWGGRGSRTWSYKGQWLLEVTPSR